MSAEDPIAAYLMELRSHLRVRGPRRRRIVDEVEAHLFQRRSDLQRAGAIEPCEAAREAVARFGDPRQLADQFNHAHHRLRIVEHRLVALWVAWIAAMGMGTATVWAAVDSSGQGAGSPAHRAGAPTRESPLCALAASHPANLLDLAGKTHILQAGEHRRHRGDQTRCQ